MPGDSLTSEITTLLHRWSEGDREALALLTSTAYSDLRTMAASYVRREAPGHTLQATSLVNELYLRLAHLRHVKLSDRRHFYAFAAQLMRMILIDHARQTRTQKRAGNQVRVPLHEEMAWTSACGDEAIALNAALNQLEEIDARKVRVIELRFFLGCTNEEAADILEVSRTTVDRDLEFAKAWLYRQLHARPSRRHEEH